MLNLGALAPLSKWERAGRALLIVTVIVFGAIVEHRSAFLSRRMGDLGCYLRGAWAVRAGGELYDVTDDNHWHYNYPPLLAILMSPLADPPAGEDHTYMMPYAASVAIWYVFSVLCLVLALHLLASALEQNSADAGMRTQPCGCRRWWALRLFPLLACLPPIGHSLMRGQANPLLLALLCGAIAAVLLARHFQAGLWLAGAICLKIFPAFLLIYPLWRRDWRMLAGCAAGLFVGMVLIPVAVFGPSRTIHHYDKLARVLVGPGLGSGNDLSRADELTNVTSTDSQSFLATLHNTLHVDRATRPRQASVMVRIVSTAIGGCLTLITLLAAGRRKPLTAPCELMFFGGLVLMMLLLSPVCHLHYFSLSVPIVTGLLTANWQGKSHVGLAWPVWLLLIANVAVNAIPNFNYFDLLRDCGAAMYMALMLWLVAVNHVWKEKRLQAPQDAAESKWCAVAA